MDSLPSLANSPHPSHAGGGRDMYSLHWSPGEKVIARRAIQQVLQREFAAVIEQTRSMADKITEPEDLWKLEDFLTRSRKQIDRDYDYRHSMLPMVFGALLRRGRIEERDLQGLGEDKLSWILKVASF